MISLVRSGPMPDQCLSGLTRRRQCGLTERTSSMTELSRSLVPDDAAGEPRDINTQVAHPARVYDYWLGGKDNFAADREAGEQAVKAYPDLVIAVRANR